MLSLFYRLIVLTIIFMAFILHRILVKKIIFVLSIELLFHILNVWLLLPADISRANLY
jgi:hypothetical protein